MKLQSPRDLDIEDGQAEGAGALRPLGEAAFYWRYKPEFGAWLRQAREARGLTLRAAAAELEFSFTKLQKLEVSGRNKAPSLGLLQRIATLYGRPLGEVLEAAGVEVALPPDVYAEVNQDDAFAALVLHPALRPVRMEPAWLDSFSSVHKQQWVEFALRLEQHLAAGGMSVSEILRQGVQAATAAGEGSEEGGDVTQSGESDTDAAPAPSPPRRERR